MTTLQKTKLRDVVAALADRIRKYQDRRLGESNTKASLVEPLLEAVGWDIRDPDEVHREFKPTSRDCPVDYALKLLRKPRLFVEAKGLGETLSDRKWITQVLGYAIVTGVEWCVLTDGDEYRLYNATAAVDADEKLFWGVRLSDDDADDSVRTLSLISKANLEENLLDTMWSAHFVDRRVKAVMRAMIDQGDRGLIRLIRRSDAKLSPSDVAGALRRLDVRIDAAPMPADNVGRLGGASVVSRRKRPKQTSTGRPKRKRPVRMNVALAELVTAGILQAPLVLFRKYKGRLREARLLPNGSLDYAGKNYDSCSMAAAAARGSITGRPMATNGWDFWQFADGDGKRVPLDTARQQWLTSRH